ncbi:hypothetical protein GCM10009589_27540 [Arthrobacter pascens]
MHGLEGPGERLGRAIPVSDRYVQYHLAGDNFRCRCCQPPTPDVLRQRQASKRGKHPPKVILRGEGDLCQTSNVDRRGKVRLDEFNGPVPFLRGYLLASLRYEDSGPFDPTIPARKDQNPDAAVLFPFLGPVPGNQPSGWLVQLRHDYERRDPQRCTGTPQFRGDGLPGVGCPSRGVE